MRFMDFLHVLLLESLLQLEFNENMRERERERKNKHKSDWIGEQHVSSFETQKSDLSWRTKCILPWDPPTQKVIELEEKKKMHPLGARKVWLNWRRRCFLSSGTNKGGWIGEKRWDLPSFFFKDGNCQTAKDGKKECGFGFLQSGFAELLSKLLWTKQQNLHSVWPHTHPKQQLLDVVFLFSIDSFHCCRIFLPSFFCVEEL